MLTASLGPTLHDNPCHSIFFPSCTGRYLCRFTHGVPPAPLVELSDNSALLPPTRGPARPPTHPPG